MTIRKPAKIRKNTETNAAIGNIVSRRVVIKETMVVLAPNGLGMVAQVGLPGTHTAAKVNTIGARNKRTERTVRILLLYLNIFLLIIRELQDSRSENPLPLASRPANPVGDCVQSGAREGVLFAKSELVIHNNYIFNPKAT